MSPLSSHENGSRCCDLTTDAYRGIIFVRKPLAVKNKGSKHYQKTILSGEYAYKETVPWLILRPEWMN